MKKNWLRLGFATVIILSTIYILAGTAAAPQYMPERVESGEVAPPSNGTTVITTQSYGKKGWHNKLTGDSPGSIIAVSPDGSPLYYDDSYQSYWDVDPSPAGDKTVTYLASEHLSPSECKASTECYRNLLLQTNLSTGNTELIHAETVRNEQSVRWHDADRLDSHRFVVAGMDQDRVFIINTTSGITEWSWNAQSGFPLESGGKYPLDWTHVNDVEELEDGRIMVSLRNQDRVVFLSQQSGVNRSMTLGEEDNYKTLAEQHNPDYIDEGGEQSVLVADSGNGRVVEYHRVGETWQRSWRWNDSRMSWPRDADRLPNGNTLITDSNGGRVIEINPAGNVVWSMNVALPYEAERLGTGDESTGGQTARQANLQTRVTGASTSGNELSLRGIVFRLLPGEILVAISWILPRWMGVLDAGILFAGLGACIVWVSIEIYWLPYGIITTWPVRIERK